MRLIDADALKEAMKYNGSCGICTMYIDDADTIDAIPVEWFSSQMKNNPNDIESAYDDICINELIQKWQKEQEAR